VPRGYNTITQRVRYQSVVIFPALELIRVTPREQTVLRAFAIRGS